MCYNFILQLPGAVCLFWSILFFLNWKKNLRSQKVLAFAGLMCCISFLNLSNYVTGTTDTKAGYLLDVFDPSLFTPSVMYLYFRSLTSEKRFGWRDYLWFLPPLVVEGTTIGVLLYMGQEKAQQLFADLIGPGTDLTQYSDTVYRLYDLFGIKIYNGLGLLLFVSISIYALVSIVRYHYRLRDFYSELDDKSMGLNYRVWIWFLLSSILGVVIFFLHWSFLEQSPAVGALFFLSETVVAFCLCYCSYRMQYSVDNFACDLEPSDGDATDDTSAKPLLCAAFGDDLSAGSAASGRFDMLAEEFRKLIDEDRIFLRSSLRADEVARMMHTNRTYVSRMIRDEFDSNFSDYINGRRIEYSQKLMRSNPDMRLAELAEASGFINAPSFCRMFRQITGNSPKEWQKEVSE